MIAESCQRIMNDVGLAQRLSENGLRMAQKYQWKSVIQNLIELFSKE